MKREYRELCGKGGYRAVGGLHGVSGGLAHMIIKDGYMPTDETACLALGLPVTVKVELDPKTGRLHIPAEIKIARMKAPRKRLDEMSEDEIRWALEHRVEVQ